MFVFGLIRGVKGVILTMKFNELEKGQIFNFAGCYNSEVDYKIILKTDSTIHFVGLTPGPVYIILDEYFAWVALVTLK